MARKFLALTLASATVVAAVMLAAGSASQAQVIDKKAAAEGLITPESTGCAYNFTASQLKWCVSEHGNLNKFESPAGREHLSGYVEGYLLCVNGALKGYDMGYTEGGFGAATVIAGPTASSVTIRRKTTDGTWQLDQKWSRDTTEHDVTLQMTVKNLSGAAATNVWLHRVADIDTNGETSNFYDQSAYGIWTRVWPWAFTMSGLSVVPNFVGVSLYRDVTPECRANGMGLGSTEDIVGNVVYIFNVASGRQKVLKIGYRAQ